MRMIVLVMLLACAGGCTANPEVRLAPREPPAPLLGIPLAVELDVAVVDALNAPIEGAEVILQAQPDPRRAITPASGIVRFVGVFVVDPRFLIACAEGFVCSAWIDRETPGSGSLSQRVTLQRLTRPKMPSDVAPPSSDFITYVEGERVRVSIPSNWRELPGSNAVTFAPEGAYGNAGAKSVFTHGLSMGLARNDKHDLRATTDDFIDAYVLVNPGPKAAFLYDTVTMGTRPGLHAVLATVSEVDRIPVRIEVRTTLFDEDTLFYVLTVVPLDLAASYASTFQRIVTSITIMDHDAVRSSRESPGRPQPPDCRENRERAGARPRPLPSVCVP